MDMRELGRTGINVSKICLGTMTWGEQNTEDEGHRQIDMALDYGVNFLDSAEMYAVPARAETYGRTEEIIGSWLKKSGKRDQIVLATKVAGPAPHLKHIRPDMLRDGKNDLHYDSVIAACDASLKRLGTDYIDLYQVHWPSRRTAFFGFLRYKTPVEDPSVPLEETLEALKTLKDAGKIRAIGLSNETAWGVMHALHLSETKGLPRVASVQNPYNLLNRSFETGLSEVAYYEGCGLLAYSPLASGYLTGKYSGGARPEGGRLTRFPQTFGRYLKTNGEAAMERYVALALDNGWDPAQMANAFVNMQPFLTSNIIGATSEQQLETALKTHEMTIPEDMLKEIDSIEAEYTLPCP